jgi:membrane-bound serine protease (ClpP class)
MLGIVVYKVAQARRMKVKVGPEQLIGKVGTVTASLTPRGEVRVEGQTWRAESVGGEAKAGAQIVVINREGLILKVKPTESQK